MIVQNELAVPSRFENALSSRPALARTASNHLLWLAVFFALAVALQIASGAYAAEFGGYPDEPAHYVTSLMMREYVTGPNPLSPMQFAQQYYAHYPKVAFGHWPPLFYMVQALWMILFSPARVSVLLELAVTTAFLAYSVYSEARRWFGWTAGALAGLLTVCLPVVQRYTDEEMAEILLVLVCFWSAIYFARYLDSERWQDSLWFGVFFSLAVLTKGNGWLLAMVPPIALVLTRKLRLLFRPSFWVSALLVAIICVPWQLTTMHLAEEGWNGGSHPNMAYTISALGQFLLLFARLTGPFLALLILIGLAVEVFIPMFRRPVAAGPAVMAAFICAVWIFHSVVPAGVEDRKLIIAIPALILFLLAGGFWVARHLPLPHRIAHWRYAAVALVAAAFFFFETFSIPRETHFGYHEAAQFLTSTPQFRGNTILVASGSIGEGLLVSEIAMRQPRPVDTIIRATKALAKMNWNGSEYRSLYSTPEQLLSFLARKGVQLVVTDTWKGGDDLAHVLLLHRTIAESGRFLRVATFSPRDSSAQGEVDIYRFAAAGARFTPGADGFAGAIPQQ